MTRIKTSKMPEYMWVVAALDDKGWGAEYDGLWGSKSRVYLRKRDAIAHRNYCTSAGCWEGETPEFRVEKMDVGNILEDHHLRDDLLSAIDHPMVNALRTAEAEIDSLARDERAARRRQGELAAHFGRFHRVLMEWAMEKCPHGRAVSYAITAADLGAEWMTHEMRMLVGATVGELLQKGADVTDALRRWEQSDPLRRVMRRVMPSVRAVTKDGEYVMICHINVGKYDQWDGWWQVEDLLAALSGYDGKEKMTADAMKRVGVFR